VKSSRYDHITDNELLEYYYRDDSTEWIGILLERYTLLLLGVCMKYLKNEAEARDAVQQVFLKVLTEVSKKYEITYFKSWLYMVAKNHCLMKLRAQQGKYVTEIQDYHVPSAGTEEREDLLQHEQTFVYLEEALQELNEEQKQCVILFYLKKMSYQQVAQQTGYSMLQVKSYIQNGKRNLRIILEKKLKQKGEQR